MVFMHNFCRSCRQGSSLYLSRNGQIYQYQTYAEITSVSPSTGSIEGCTKVTVTGRNFDETKAKSQIYVGGDQTLFICKIKKKIGGGGGNYFWCFLFDLQRKY